MTTHSSGYRAKYGRRYTRDAVGTLHVPQLDRRYGPCELCGHVGALVKSAATKGKYLGDECRWLVIDDDVKAPLSERAKRAGQPQFSRWKRRTK